MMNWCMYGMKHSCNKQLRQNWFYSARISPKELPLYIQETVRLLVIVPYLTGEINILTSLYCKCCIKTSWRSNLYIHCTDRKAYRVPTTRDLTVPNLLYQEKHGAQGSYAYAYVLWVKFGPIYTTFLLHSVRRFKRGYIYSGILRHKFS